MTSNTSSAPENPQDPTPERIDAAAHVVSYRLLIPAPAGEIWALVADPHRHHEIDGSGTVRSQARGPHELAAGAQFSVHMHKYGLPYRLPLKVTQAVRPDAEAGTPGVVEWRQPTGHRWRWELAPQGPDNTLVTESYDASGQNPVVRTALGALNIPDENAAGIRGSLQRLHRRMTSRN